MKFNFFIYAVLLMLSVLSIFSQYSAAQDVKKPIVLGVFDVQNKKEFEEKLRPTLLEEVSACKTCEITNFTPYNEVGEYNPTGLMKQIEAASSASVLLVNWNEKVNPQNKDILAAFTNISNQGIVIVAAAGQPKDNESSAPLNQTLFGQIPQALIIGELGERDRLWGSSFFGPEMLTALRPPKGKIGLGFAPVLFAARMTRDFSKRSDWISFLREKKTATRKIWLELNDCFSR